MQISGTESTVRQPVHPLLGRVLSGRYEIISFAGSGGMAAVFSAQDRVLGRMVAIKILHTKLTADYDFVARFQREAEFAASLSSHPNVVSVYDLGLDGDLRYIVMEVVGGHNLGEIIAQDAPLAPGRALAIARQVALALQYAHQHHLVHRDIKPQNILLPDDDRVKVADFGLAWNTSSTPITGAGVIMGTTHYLSPEQALGKPVGPRSDLYALGVVLYEMLTGHVPFTGDDSFSVAIQQVHEPPIPPHQLNPTIPAAISNLVLKALAKDPDERFQTAEEFVLRLDELLDQPPSSTLPVLPAVARGDTGGGEPTAFLTDRRSFGTAVPVHRQPSHERIIPRFIALLALLCLLLVSGIAVAGTLQSKPGHRHPRSVARHPLPVHHRAVPPAAPCHAQNRGAIRFGGFVSDRVVARAGQPLTITYTISNSGACSRIYLGAAAISSTVANVTISDSRDAQVVEVRPGSHTYRRSLVFPASAAGQLFGLQVSLSFEHGPRLLTVQSGPDLLSVVP